MTDVDGSIFQLSKDLNPSGAYLSGFDDKVGQVFVPSQVNTDAMLKRIGDLRSRSDNRLQEGMLDSMEVSLLFEEPGPVPDEIVGTIFTHMVKEGINQTHIASVLEYGARALSEHRARLSRRDLPPSIRILGLYRCMGLKEILDVVVSQPEGSGLQAEVEKMRRELKEYEAMCFVEGFTDGRFEEVYSLLERDGDDLGRKEFYPKALRMAFDYHETPSDLESKALGWLSEELKAFRAITEELSRRYGCEQTVEAVSAAMRKRQPVEPKDLLSLTVNARETVQAFVNRTIVRVNPRYNTRLIETPSYLTQILPTGAAQFFDTFKTPFEYFFITTDEKRDPVRTIPDLLDLLVHEEYGHCVHHSNSAYRLAASPSDLELLPSSHTGPSSEGISFNRELEFLESTQALLDLGSTPNTKGMRDEKERYVKLLEGFGGLELAGLELEFEVRKGRVTRFLRVIGDSRINSGRQGLLKFIEWAHKETGLSKSHVYYQLFPAHEGIFPGYATCYAVVGQEIRSLQRKLLDRDALIKFNTYASSLGFPPRSLFTERLEKHTEALVK